MSREEPKREDPERRAKVLLVTEGTYPFIVGGVSTWCDILINGLPAVDWSVLPITAGGVARTPKFDFPENLRLAGHLDLWSESLHPWSRRRSGDRTDLAAALVDGLLRWRAEPNALVETLLWCRRHPGRVRPIFRSRQTWQSFVAALETALGEWSPDTGPSPDLDLIEVAELYRTMYWVARTAAYPTPPADAVLVTAAGWSAIPGIVHRALHGTPLILTEHGVYVREAYLAAIRTDGTPSARWVSTRLARGLSRLAYANADVVSPVTQANAAWERAFGVPQQRIRPIYNGVLVPIVVDEAPVGTKRVVSICRLDALKDVKTMLRTARAVVEEVPDARFEHFGPTPEGGEAYRSECEALHRELQLGGHFVFRGETYDAYREMRTANVVLLTSISEGFPITVLEAMANGRPVVATAVGGVSEAVFGCGFTAPPGDVSGLAAGVVALLGNPALGALLGRRGHTRAARHFGQATCLANYAALLAELTGRTIASLDVPEDPALSTETLEDLAEELALERSTIAERRGRSEVSDGETTAAPAHAEALGEIERKAAP